MNYLAHLFLAPKSKQLLVGNLMGDFVKGNRFEHLPIDIVTGIYQHRAIDKYTDQHPEVLALKACLSAERRRYFGIIVDVAFDHILAKHFQQYSHQSLVEFSDCVYPTLIEHVSLMPPRMQLVVTRMVEQRWLESYQSINAIGQAIDGISRRIRFENKLLGGAKEIEDNYLVFEQHFSNFFPELIAYSKQLAQAHDNNL